MQTATVPTILEQHLTMNFVRTIQSMSGTNPPVHVSDFKTDNWLLTANRLRSFAQDFACWAPASLAPAKRLKFKSSVPDQ
jgi:hypothetical protein